MWPFKKKPVYPSAQQIAFSQVDITERFGDNGRLGVEDWIATVALNTRVPEPTTVGLPPQGAADNVTYHIAAGLSRARDLANDAADGVYCPICHIANVDLKRLHTPCPKCGRDLLRFGWN